jgi:carboxyl-terminal processing protease
MSLKPFRVRFLAAISAAIAIAFLAGAAVERRAHPLHDTPHPLAIARGPDFPLIRQAWDVINREYVDRSALRQRPLTAGAIAGMVDALGDTGHSTYLTPDMIAEERTLLRGEYVGVGLEITRKDDKVMIVAPLDNSPALQAGLRAGEQLLKVNGRSVTALGLAQVVALIMGPAGTTVVLSVFNPASHSTQEVPLKRARIHVENVVWRPLPGPRFADIRVAEFSSGVTADLRAALQKIEDMKLTGAVLDLRNNPGGDLQEAIGVASQFLHGGDVLLEKDAKGRIFHDAVQRGGLATVLPLVVLINGGTASGAEIVAGALQNARRAPLIGERTFGTGTVLEQFPLSDGSALLLAVREWLTPSGRTFWHKGIAPDVAVALPADATPLTPVSLAGMTREELDASNDLQMKKALEVLDGISRHRN